METVIKTVVRYAIDPETDERYQIDFPAPEPQILIHQLNDLLNEALRRLC